MKKTDSDSVDTPDHASIHDNVSEHIRGHGLSGRFSRITLRILAVNLLAPAILVAGIFYLDEYRRNLISTELSGLRTHAEIFAVALGESAVSPRGQALLPELSSQIVRRLAFTAKTRARLFLPDGRLAADSRKLLEPGGQVQQKDLPPPVTAEEKESFLSTIFQAIDRIYNWLPGGDEYATYRENIQQRASDYPEVMAAMGGEVWVARRSMPDRSLVLTVAMPVTRYKQTLGVIFLSKGSDEIDAAVYEVRLDILKVFGVVLIITIGVSLYLAGTIARPIRSLALAAEHIRKGHHRQHKIPNFGERSDEIGELARALGDMTEALWARMDAIERFAADVAHEIKNPLTSIKSAVETATRIENISQQKKLMAIIQDDVERLDRLITDISDASRLDAELSRAETVKVNISSMLETLVSIHDATKRDGEPVAVLKVEENLITEGMEDRLVQVFRNLLVNAITFSPDGGIIKIAATKNNSDIIITVSDDGPGITPGKEMAIFDRFYTERPVAEKFGTHSGLGLAISKQIIDAYGGQIMAENMINQAGKITGARFRVCLTAVS
ncbi:MAG: stimulus-sensing domain-containing protein [Rhodospirillaceae bacterium]|nr:stimulus-sensing domain-containing protein [Rhodospirillaceae bacterium]